MPIEQAKWNLDMQLRLIGRDAPRAHRHHDPVAAHGPVDMKRERGYCYSGASGRVCRAVTAEGHQELAQCSLYSPHLSQKVKLDASDSLFL